MLLTRESFGGGVFMFGALVFSRRLGLRRVPGRIDVDTISARSGGHCGFLCIACVAAYYPSLRPVSAWIRNGPADPSALCRAEWAGGSAGQAAPAALQCTSAAVCGSASLRSLPSLPWVRRSRPVKLHIYVPPWTLVSKRWATMDPFSITCGAVGLVDAGINVARELKTKIDLYKSAEQDIKELAHEVDLCTSLLDIFGNSLDRPESAYPQNVVKQTKRLVADVSCAAPGPQPPTWHRTDARRWMRSSPTSRRCSRVSMSRGERPPDTPSTPSLYGNNMRS